MVCSEEENSSVEVGGEGADDASHAQGDGPLLAEEHVGDGVEGEEDAEGVEAEGEQQPPAEQQPLPACEAHDPPPVGGQRRRDDAEVAAAAVAAANEVARKIEGFHITKEGQTEA